MSLLGIDLGTSGCKAAVFSEEGQLLAAAYTEFDAVHPQAGYAELDASRVWETVKQLIQQVCSRTDARLIRALSVSSMGEAVVPVRLNHQILGPSLFNFDRRGEEFLADLRAAISDERLYRINGNLLGNQYSLTKLMWVKRHWPEIYDQADLFLHWSGFIEFMLGADPALDFSLANRTLLFDLDRECWSEELFASAGLDSAKLPRLVPSGTVVGSVAGSIALELGLPAGIAIVAGGHDQNVNAIGCGAIEAGQAVFGMGTFICITPVYAHRMDPARMIAQGLNTEHHSVPGKYVSFIYNQGGALLKWYRDTYAAAEKSVAAATGRDLYADLLREMPEEPASVIVLPHFMQTGPPDFISDTSGVMVGLKLETTRAEILKGMLEGASFYLKECVDALPAAGIDIQNYRVVGGGSKSDAWIQLSADIFGAPFARPSISEAGTLGAAILAGVGAGAFQNAAQGVAAMVKFERTFEPDLAKRSLYLEKYAQYKQLWPLLGNYLKTVSRRD